MRQNVVWEMSYRRDTSEFPPYDMLGMDLQLPLDKCKQDWGLWSVAFCIFLRISFKKCSEMLFASDPSSAVKSISIAPSAKVALNTDERNGEDISVTRSALRSPLSLFFSLSWPCHTLSSRLPLVLCQKFSKYSENALQLLFYRRVLSMLIGFLGSLFLFAPYLFAFSILCWCCSSECTLYLHSFLLIELWPSFCRISMSFFTWWLGAALVLLAASSLIQVLLL